jgi:hypothetical protein
MGPRPRAEIRVPCTTTTTITSATMTMTTIASTSMTTSTTNAAVGGAPAPVHVNGARSDTAVDLAGMANRSAGSGHFNCESTAQRFHFVCEWGQNAVMRKFLRTLQPSQWHTRRIMSERHRVGRLFPPRAPMRCRFLFVG